MVQVLLFFVYNKFSGFVVFALWFVRLVGVIVRVCCVFVYNRLSLRFVCFDVLWFAGFGFAGVVCGLYAL